MVELGQVGQAATLSLGSGRSMPGDSQDIRAFYVHSQRGAKCGDSSVLTEAFLKAGDAKVCLLSTPNVHRIDPDHVGVFASGSAWISPYQPTSVSHEACYSSRYPKWRRPVCLGSLGSHAACHVTLSLCSVMPVECDYSPLSGQNNMLWQSPVYNSLR